MQRLITRGASANAGLIFHVFVQDSTSTTGAGKASLVYSDFSCRYIRNGEAISGAITPEDITTIGTYAAPTANTNIRIKAVDNTNMIGVYEVQIHSDWVNTTNSCQSLTIYLSASGAAVRPFSIPLMAINIQDSVRLGLTALPNAAADAAGGLPISDAGGLDLDNRMPSAASITNMNTVFTTDFATNYDATLDMWNSNVLLILGVTPWNPATDRVIANVDQLGGDAQSLADLKDLVDTGYDPTTHLSSTDLKYVDGAALDTHASGQVPADSRSWLGTTIATPDTAGYPKATIKSGTGMGEISLTSGAVNFVNNARGSEGYLLATTVGSVTSQTQLVQSFGSSLYGYYVGRRIYLDDADSNDFWIGYVTAYSPVTGFTLDSIPSFTVVAGDGLYVLNSVGDPATVGVINAAAVKNLFDTDSTTTAASAVAGSLVKEIIDNASGGGGSDPWETALPGSYLDGTAGKLLADASSAITNAPDFNAELNASDLAARIPATLVDGKMDSTATLTTQDKTDIATDVSDTVIAAIPDPQQVTIEVNS